MEIFFLHTFWICFIYFDKKNRLCGRSKSSPVKLCGSHDPKEWDKILASACTNWGPCSPVFQLIPVSWSPVYLHNIITTKDKVDVSWNAHIICLMSTNKLQFVWCTMYIVQSSLHSGSTVFCSSALWMGEYQHNMHFSICISTGSFFSPVKSNFA